MYPEAIHSNDGDGLPVAVIGSGPVGLAAACHLLERGFTPLVVEAGDAVAAGMASWGHVRVFSPWRYNVDAAATRLLEGEGWSLPTPEDYPTGEELRRDYLIPLAETEALKDKIRLSARVISVTRLRRDKMKNAGRDAAPFELVIETKQGRERLLARAVIDASGSMLSPNPLGASGIPAIGEEASATRIAYGIPNVFADPRRYGGRTVLVVGSGHSAMNVLRDLVALKADQPATQILWAVRRRSDLDLYGGGGADALPERGRLGSVVERLVGEGAIALTTGVEIDGLERSDDGVVVHHRDGRLGPVDEIIAATGFRPELDSLRELRLALDSIVEAPTAIAPLIDPNFHSCGSVPPHGALELAHPESDFYIAGMKSYGRAPTFLMLTGYEQVRSIAAALAGDLEAAARVELVLPETGVCKGPAPGPDDAGNVACCVDPPAVAGASGALLTKTPSGIKAESCCGATEPTETSCCG